MADEKLDPDTSAAENLGSHLLKRLPSPEDERDNKYLMSDALKKLQDPPAPDDSLAGKTFKQAFDEGYFSSYRAFLHLWKWIKGYFGKTPTPPQPTPPAPLPAIQYWWNRVQLDQGQTGHCVGFGSTDWKNAPPTEATHSDDDAHAFYYLCKDKDGEPKGTKHAEDGTYVRTAAQVLQDQGAISNYVWGKSAEEVSQWVIAHGPVILGTDWYNGMFNPDSGGLVKLTGGVAGGHCYLAIGYDDNRQVFTCQNSWGDQWGIASIYGTRGCFEVSYADLDKLIKADGEACAGVEVPLP